MLQVNATALLKSFQKESRNLSVICLENVWVEGKDARLVKGKHVVIFHSDGSANRNIKIHFGAWAALCKYSQRPCDMDHLSTSASLLVSPVHNLSLKKRRAGHWRRQAQDPEGARPRWLMGWRESKVHYGPGAKRRSQVASWFESSQVFSKK